jgi:peroxiredoxin
MKSTKRPIYSIKLNTLVIIASIAIQSPAALASVKIGTTAPNFTLKSASGKNLKLSEYRGKVVLLNFWATWCGPCREEIPQLNKLQRKFKSGGFTVLGVNIDRNHAPAKVLARKLRVRFPILFDSNKAVSRLYQVDAMPNTVIIDRNGVIRFVHRGYVKGYENAYREQVRQLLRE